MSWLFSREGGAKCYWCVSQELWPMLHSMPQSPQLGLGTHGYNLDETGENLTRSTPMYCVVHGCGLGRMPGEHRSGYATAIFKVSHAKEKKKKNHFKNQSKSINHMPAFQNDKHLYFIWAHSENSHSPCCLAFIFKNCVRLIFLWVPGIVINLQHVGLGAECNLCCWKTGQMWF